MENEKGFFEEKWSPDWSFWTLNGFVSLVLLLLLIAAVGTVSIPEVYADDECTEGCDDDHGEDDHGEDDHDTDCEDDHSDDDDHGEEGCDDGGVSLNKTRPKVKVKDYLIKN
ncbi:MAG: hypothetical protein ACE5FU_10555 [Nitrospinota bacterium]